MSDSDSFINEVSEEVRRDRMFALWRKYGPYVIGAIVLIVAAAGVKAYLDAQETAAAREAGAALLEASEGDLEAQKAALTALAENADHDGARLLAELRAASAMAASGDAGAAAEAYDRIAAFATRTARTAFNHLATPLLALAIRKDRASDDTADNRTANRGLPALPTFPALPTRTALTTFEMTSDLPTDLPALPATGNHEAPI